MIDINSKYQMMHYLVMDIPYTNANDTFIEIVKENTKVSDFIKAFRSLITHYYQDLFKEVDQQDQVEKLIPAMDSFYEYIIPYYNKYKLEVQKVISEKVDNELFVNTISELISIRVMVIAASSYFKIATGKKSSKLRRLSYLINMIIIIYDETKAEIDIDNVKSVSESLNSLLDAMESYYK